MNNKIIGQRINAALASKDIKQKELAQELKVSDNTISYFVSGKRTPNTEQIIKISQILDVSTDYLLGKTEAKTVDKTIQAICDYTGLDSDVIEILHNWNDMGNRHYFLKYPLDFINVFLSTKGVEDIFKEVYNYIESIKFCACLESEYKDIDFSVNSIIDPFDPDNEELKRKNEILKKYHNSKRKTQRVHLFNAYEMFLDFVKSYGEYEKENFNVYEYLDKEEKNIYYSDKER